MNACRIAPSQQSAPRTFDPVRRDLLQRKCACGGVASPTGECEACRNKRLRRKAPGPETGTRSDSSIPPIVHEVLRSPGMPLDPATRAFMEPRFGHDFSHIRVHSDARAAESAEAIDALAYAVGSHVVFGAQQYVPETRGGLRLLSHELAHTIQSPAGSTLHPSLEVGRPDDPAEHEADQIADAVLSGQLVSVSPTAQPALRRQRRTCTASAADQADRRIVRCTDGTEYRITLSITDPPARSQTQTSTNAGWNNQNIWLDINVCRRGTEVQITPTVDLPRAVVQVLGNVLAGSGALTGVRLTPGLRITIAQSQSFTLTLEPNVTVDQSGVSGGGLSATVQTPDVTVTAAGTYDARNQAGMLTFTFSGGRPQRTIDCRSFGRRKLVFECERITRIPAVPAVPEQTEMDTEVRYVFFDYKTANLRLNPPLPTDLQSLHDAGYVVTSIEGYTSPEGPRDPGPNFEGNITLADARAARALRWLREEACPGCDTAGVTTHGRSELPSQLGAAMPEPGEGRRMERAAVEEFLGVNPSGSPDPLAPQNPAALAAFRRLPAGEQRERAFRLMRRAAITLRRRRVVRERQPEVPARMEFNSAACEDDVIDAARTSFGITVVTGASPR